MLPKCFSYPVQLSLPKFMHKQTCCQYTSCHDHHPQIRKGTQLYPFQCHRNCKYLKNRKIQKISQDQFHSYFRLHFQYPCQQTSCTEKYQQFQDQSGNCQYQLLHFTPSLRLLWQGFPLQPSPE